MSEAQDATALAERIKKHLSVCTKLGHDTVGLFEEALADLLATPQTPDAVSRIRARRLDTGLRNKWEAQVDKIPVGRAASEAGALKMAEQKLMALSTPYALQAEAKPHPCPLDHVAGMCIWPDCNCSRAVAWRYRYKAGDCSVWMNAPVPENVSPELILELAYAHPQPQQADERGAVIEAAADAIDAARYAHPDHPRERPRPFAEADRGDREYAFRLARAALQQSPTTE